METYVILLIFLLGVRYPHMMNTLEDITEHSPAGFQLLKRKLGVIQLPRSEFTSEDAINEFFELLGSRIFEAFAGRLGTIG